MKKLLYIHIALSIFNFQFSTSFAQTQLWGVTILGGQYDAGVIFKTDGSGNNQTVQYNFDNAANGGDPSCSLIQTPDGMLYGLAAFGGANNVGIIYQYDPRTFIFTKKFDFDTINGIYPDGFLLVSGGTFYGTAITGGVHNGGVIFQYNPISSTFTKKFDFDGALNGNHPENSLMQATDGMLYGMTRYGGAYNDGVIFQYDLLTSTYNKKFDFDFNNAGGIKPEGGLMQALDGMLYGMTRYGGANNVGIIFQYNPVSSIYTKKFDFDGTMNGSYPLGSLMQASDGMLYGMTTIGGAYNLGVLFQYNPATSSFIKKVDFDKINGGNPVSSLMQASDGMLYGMTSLGGATDSGVIFQYNTITSTYIKKLDMSWKTGDLPTWNLLEIPVTITTASLTTNSCLGDSINVAYAIAGAYDAGNVFTVQLSDAAGSFTSPVNIGSITSINAGNVNVVVPVLNTAGSSYKIRVVSSNPVITGNSVAYNSAPIVNLGNDTIVCQTQSVTLNGGFASSYLWSNGFTTSSINVSTSGTYWVEANNGQCTKRDTITINVNSLPLPTITTIANPSSAAVCIGKSVTLTAAGNAVAYTWSGGIVDSQPFTPLQTTTYTLTGTDTNNCKRSVIRVVSVFPLPTVGSTVVPSATVCVGVSVTFAGTGATTYFWSDGVKNDTAFVPTATTTYTVTGTDANACVNTAEQMITVNVCSGIETMDENSQDIIIYPNPSTGIVRIEGQFKKAQIKITDVYGQIIYEHTSTLQGEEQIDLSNQANGIYFISIQANENIANKKIIISK